MNTLDPSLPTRRRLLSLDPRFMKFFGIVVWVVIFVGYLATMPMSPRYSRIEVVATLTFILGGLALLVFSLRRYRQVSLGGDCLYLIGRRSEIAVPLKWVAAVTEVGGRTSGTRTLRVRTLKRFEFGREFYFWVRGVGPAQRTIFSVYEPHPLVEELRRLVARAKSEDRTERGLRN